MDFYLILGVERSASPGEIRRAFKRLARRLHPGINPGDQVAASQFQKISEAYETLSDPERRHRYDATGNAGDASPGPSFGFEGFDFSASGGATSAGFGDLLPPRDRAGFHRGPTRGSDLHHSITVAFVDAARGDQQTVTVTRQDRCRSCEGAGYLQIPERRCGHCFGTGALRSVRRHMVFSKPCTLCGGSGRQREVRCPTCGGDQTETRTELLTVAVPPGLADGARVRVAGKGHVGRNGGENGDLYLTIHVEPHALFTREGDDLRIVVPVAVHEAALGARFEVPTLDGSVRLRVPPGTQSGQRFRLRERGLPSPRSGRNRDLIVEVRVVLPSLLDERSKELLREFGRINQEDVRKGWAAQAL